MRDITSPIANVSFFHTFNVLKFDILALWLFIDSQKNGNIKSVSV